MRGGRRSIFSALFILSGFFVSCGIDEIVYLDPPTGVSSEAAYKIYVNHVPNQSSDMIGYEIFYRMYASREKATSDYTTISGYNSSNPTMVKTLILNTLKYFRLSEQNIDIAAPLVAVESTLSNVTFTLDFSQFPDSEPQMFLSGDISGSFNVYRGIADTAISSSAGTSFSVINPTSTDGDFDPTDIVPASPYFYIQFCIFTYGMDSSFNPIYSTALVVNPLTLAYKNE